MGRGEEDEFWACLPYRLPVLFRCFGECKVFHHDASKIFSPSNHDAIGDTVVPNTWSISITLADLLAGVQ